MSGLVREIEQAAYRSWTSEESVEVGSWAVRAAGGLSRRLNSAEPVDGASVEDLITDLGDCRAWMAARELPVVVRVTPLRPEGMGAALERRGFREEGETHVMKRAIAGSTADYPARVVARRTDGWVEAQLHLKGAETASPSWIAVLDRVPEPAAFAELTAVSGEPVAAGLGVLSGTWLAVFDVNVAVDRRRLGHGRKLMEVLHSWAAARGGSHVFLQVQGDNEPALGLYRSLGYESAYRYHYLREPGMEIAGGGVGEASAEGDE